MALRENEGIYEGEEQELRPDRPLLSYGELRDAIVSIENKHRKPPKISRRPPLKEEKIQKAGTVTSTGSVHHSHVENRNSNAKRSASSVAHVKKLQRDSHRRGISVPARSPRNLPMGICDRFGGRITYQERYFRMAARPKGREKADEHARAITLPNKAVVGKHSERNHGRCAPEQKDQHEKLCTSSSENVVRKWQSVRDRTWGFVDGIAEVKEADALQDFEVQSWGQVETDVTGEKRTQTWSDEDNSGPSIAASGHRKYSQDRASQFLHSWGLESITPTGGETKKWSNSDDSDDKNINKRMIETRSGFTNRGQHSGKAKLKPN